MNPEAQKMVKQKWTTENIPDLTGKVIIVTGANSGIGFEAAKEFARKGAQTTLACRDLGKAHGVQSQIQAEFPAAKTEIMQLDLASLDSINQFAAAFKANYDHLDILVNNAGLSMLNYNTTADGFEMNVGVNHLGHFALTGLLLDALEKSAAARVVSVSSVGHRSGLMDFDNLIFKDGRDFSLVASYARSKLANLLFAYELQRRAEAAGSGVISVAAHPGLSRTNLGRSMIEKWQWRMMLQMYEWLHLTQSAAMGALPILRVAVDAEVKGGEYYGPDGFKEFRGYPVLVQSSEASHSREDALRLWELSEELTRVSYSLRQAKIQGITQD